MSLALLARCVALLPHDRTQLQRDKLTNENAFLNIPLAWVPVLFAVLICGFQLSFWENAIVGTGEMLDLLLFAYCVRCLLEYRVDEENRWLYKLALVYGLGMTNNFAMIAFLPALLVAVVWIKGLRFFRFDFLVRMFLFGLLGLSFYLLLPLIQGGSDELSFWQALKSNLGLQKHLVFDNRKIAMLPAVYALLPLVLLGIRWPSGFGDQSPVGSVFANGAAILLHAGLLAFCIYIAFDPPISPRIEGAKYRAAGYNYVFLPCYFLGALIVGYYSGFLLLVFSKGSGRNRKPPTMPAALNYPVAILVCGSALFVVGALAYRNFPRIKEFSSPSLQDYTKGLIASLPEKPAVVLSDEPVTLHAVRALLGRPASDKYLFVESTALDKPGYHRFLARQSANDWPRMAVEKDAGSIAPQQVMQWLSAMGQKAELIYLHPSFGYFFETYYLEPRKLVFTLKPYPPGAADTPLPNAALIAQQAAAWNSLTDTLNGLKSTVKTQPEDRAERVQDATLYVASFYSRSLNWWGVELQRAGRFEDAARYFEEAVALNPDNAAALLNRDANALWRNGQQRLGSMNTEQQEKLALYRGMEALLMACGPVDVPEFNAQFSQTLVQAGLYRQASHVVRRALAYAPKEPMFELALAKVELFGGNNDDALALIASLKPRAQNADPSTQIDIARVEAFAQNARTNFPEAKRILEDAVRRFPEHNESHKSLSQLHVDHAQKLNEAGKAAEASVEMTNAIRVIENQLKLQPQNAAARFDYGWLLLSVKDFDGATTQFTKVLELQKDNSAALLNRAIANFQARRIDAAKRDYQDMLTRFTTTDFRVYYGLGEIAFQQNDWKAARDNYQQYLRYAPPNAAEAKLIRARLDEVKKKS